MPYSLPKIILGYATANYTPPTSVVIQPYTLILVLRVVYIHACAERRGVLYRLWCWSGNSRCIESKTRYGRAKRLRASQRQLCSHCGELQHRHIPEIINNCYADDRTPSKGVASVQHALLFRPKITSISPYASYYTATRAPFGDLYPVCRMLVVDLQLVAERSRRY
ncbi:gdsl-like lipase acylhydrolase domain protein [Moniliophthora roreri]|nr:gdsl-like lipase acylhydrolase domain protein [Moniliophthora roreri]